MEKFCLKKEDNERKQNKPKQGKFKDDKKDRYNFVAISLKREDKTSKEVSATPKIKSNVNGGYFASNSIKEWILDSGASFHMTRDRSLLIDYYEEKIQIKKLLLAINETVGYRYRNC